MVKNHMEGGIGTRTEQSDEVTFADLGPPNDRIRVEIRPGRTPEAPPAEEVDFSVFGSNASRAKNFYQIAYNVIAMPFVTDSFPGHAERRDWEARLEKLGEHDADLERFRRTKLSSNKLGQALSSLSILEMYSAKLENQDLAKAMRSADPSSPSVKELIQTAQNMESLALAQRIELAKQIERKVDLALRALATHLSQIRATQE